MHWQTIRNQYPQRWLLVEAMEAHTEFNHRMLDQLAVIDAFEDSRAALQSYRHLHRQAPQRELYVLHTSREELDITELHWFGVRGMECKDFAVQIGDMDYGFPLDGIVGMDFLTQVGAQLDLANMKIFNTTR